MALNISSAIAIASAAFVAVSIDELFALVLFFAAATATATGKTTQEEAYEGITVWDVVLGQYLAFTLVLLVSLSVALFPQNFISPQYIALLGLLPLCLGLYQLVAVIKFWVNYYKNERSGFKPIDIELAKSSESTANDTKTGNQPVELFENCFVIIPIRKQLLIVLAVLLADGTEEIFVFAPIFATTSSTSISSTSSTDWTNMLVILMTFYVWITAFILIAFSFVSCTGIGSAISRYSKNVMPLLVIGLGVYVLKNSVLADWF